MELVFAQVSSVLLPELLDALTAEEAAEVFFRFF
jgi:hypothetical protein